MPSTSDAASAASAAPDTYIYADNAATTPLSPRALEAMTPYLTSRFGNPSGIHRVAREAARALADARARMAELLGADDPTEIFFTSGGTESDNWVLRGAVARWRAERERAGAAPANRATAGAAAACSAASDKKNPSYGRCAAAGTAGGPRASMPLVVTSAIEHHAVLHTCEALAAEGAQVTYLPVDAAAQVGTGALEDALAGQDGRVALVSVMLANNEIGTIEDVAALARAAHAHGAPFHTDAVQAVGHIPVSVGALGVDALSLSAHKFHGPRGVGALYLRRGFNIPAFIRGGAQEMGLRAGTENLAGAVGMVAALEEQLEGLEANQRRVAGLRNKLVDAVCAALPGIHPTGDAVRRLPSIASFACENIDGELAVVILDQLGVAAATGSACSTGSTDPSHVVAAIGAPANTLHGTLRLSLADTVTEAEVDLLIQRTVEALRRARSLSAMV